MKTSPLSQIDLISLIEQDARIGVVIATRDGTILSHNATSLEFFGVGSQHEMIGKNMREVFVHEFAEERMRWIEKTINENRPMKIVHVMRGRQIASTLMPLNCPDENDCQECRESRTVVTTNPRLCQDRCVAVLTRYATSDEKEKSTETEVLESGLVDLGPLERLSARELEVFVLLGHGHTIPETAKLLHRSPRTIEQHKASIGRKLGMSTIAQIAKTVGELGLRVDDAARQRIQAIRPEFANTKEK
ncbi:LuxR family transcriptional regulator [Neorhodopirellula pilleata]|nr:LuxR C-terminal-related transcriptional regulator [Neorhodopirellula pilleata]